MASSASHAARSCALACRRVARVPQQSRAWQLRRPGFLTPVRLFATTQVRATDGNSSQRGGNGGDSSVSGSGSSSSGGGGPASLDESQQPSQALLEDDLASLATPDDLRYLDELAKNAGHNTLEDYLQSSIQEFSRSGAGSRSVQEAIVKADIGEKPNKASFWYDEDDPETYTEEPVEFDEDDITPMAHGKLDEVRDMRHYNRLAVWEMPLLSKFAKPFVPPTDDQVLRWRYTTYMGETHPGERKVVVQFAPDDLKLTAVQTEKLKKLAGPRYNPETELVKMSCESFEHQAQNKRRLLDLVEDLIAAAKDPSDTFEDVPLDLRHHRFRSKPSFPAEWRLTDERRRQLDERRQKLAALDAKKAEAGQLVDGKKVIDSHLMSDLATDREKQAAAVMAGPSQHGSLRGVGGGASGGRARGDHRATTTW